MASILYLFCTLFWISFDLEVLSHFANYKLYIYIYIYIYISEYRNRNSLRQNIMSEDLILLNLCVVFWAKVM